jgi:hypothetical protein
VACTQDPLACFAGAGYHIHRLVSHASYLHTGHFCRLLSFAGTTAQSQLPDLENQWLTAGCISLMFLGHPQVGENIVLTTEEPWANWQVPICHDKLGTSMFSHVVLPMPIIWKFALETLPRTKSPNALHLLPSHPFPGSCTSSQTPRRRYPHINKRPSPPKFSNNSRPEHNYEDNGGSIQGAPRRWDSVEEMNMVYFPYKSSPPAARLRCDTNPQTGYCPHSLALSSTQRFPTLPLSSRPAVSDITPQFMHELFGDAFMKALVV